MKEFHFNAELARCYGVDEAVFLHALTFWVEKNRANGRNFHDGHYWTYNSKKALAQLFPFWTERQLDRIIASCKAQGALLTGNYNPDGRDRTTWYAVTAKVLDCYGVSGPDRPVECNAPAGEMQSTGCGDAPHEPVKSYKEQLLTPVISPHKPPAGGGRADIPAEAKDRLERYVSGKPELAAAMVQYLDTRRANRKAVKTAATVDLILRKLDQLSGGDDRVKVAILEQSVERSWTGLFALDRNRDTGQGSCPSGGSRRVIEDQEVEWL